MRCIDGPPNNLNRCWIVCQIRICSQLNLISPLALSYISRITCVTRCKSQDTQHTSMTSTNSKTCKTHIDMTSSAMQRTSSGDTLSKQMGTISLVSDSPLRYNDRFILVSCRISAYSDPKFVKLETIPLASPKYLEERKEITDKDLYFLRWVFEVKLFILCFSSLSALDI
jgi:hypothetical protein